MNPAPGTDLGNQGRNRLYLNRPPSWLGSGITAEAHRTEAVALGDVDGDGDLDAVAGNDGAPNRLYLNGGAGLAWAALGITADAHRARARALADVDGDGDLDLVFGDDGLKPGLVKVNGIIPCAAVQRSTLWVGGDPNPATAIRVDDSGHYTVEAGYYFFKQACRAGQPGMAVAEVSANDSDLSLIAFTSNGTWHPDAFPVLNLAQEPLEVAIEVTGDGSEGFEAYRTSPGERYVPLGHLGGGSGPLPYRAPAGSVTTFDGC